MARRFISFLFVLLLTAQPLALAGSDTGTLAEYEEEIWYEIDLFGYSDDVLTFFDQGAEMIAAGELSYDGSTLRDFYIDYLFALKRSKLHDRADEVLFGYLATEQARVEGEIAYLYAADSFLLGASQLNIMNVGIYGRDCDTALIGAMEGQGAIFRTLANRMIVDEDMATAFKKRLDDASSMVADTNAQLFFLNQGRVGNASEVAEKAAELQADYLVRAAQGDISWMDDDTVAAYLVNMDLFYLMIYASSEVASINWVSGDDMDAYMQLYEEQYRQRCEELMLAVTGNEGIAAALMAVEEDDIVNMIDNIRIACDPPQTLVYCAAVDDSDYATITYLLLYFNYRTGQIGLDAFNKVVEASPYDVVISVESVTADGEKNGFQSGDRILSVDGERIVDYRQVLIAFSECAAETCDVTVERSGKTVTLPVPTTEPALGVALSIALNLN